MFLNKIENDFLKIDFYIFSLTRKITEESFYRDIQ